MTSLRHIASSLILALTSVSSWAEEAKSAITYEPVVETQGEKPGAQSYVRVNYVITLTDGTLMDRTEPGYPALLQMESIIPGLLDGLMLMSAGSRSRITVPPSLAYGDRGAGKIPPGAALVIDLELVDIHNNSHQE